MQILDHLQTNPDVELWLEIFLQMVHDMDIFEVLKQVIAVLYNSKYRRARDIDVDIVRTL